MFEIEFFWVANLVLFTCDRDWTSGTDDAWRLAILAEYEFTRSFELEKVKLEFPRTDVLEVKFRPWP